MYNGPVSPLQFINRRKQDIHQQRGMKLFSSGTNYSIEEEYTFFTRMSHTFQATQTPVYQGCPCFEG